MAITKQNSLRGLHYICCSLWTGASLCRWGTSQRKFTRFPAQKISRAGGNQRKMRSSLERTGYLQTGKKWFGSRVQKNNYRPAF